MAVNYSLVARVVNPNEKEQEKKIYPVAQMVKQVTLRDIAEHIHQHGSPFSVGTIVGLLLDAVSCMTENLKEGNRVDMDTLGDFYLTLTSEGADDATKFSPSMIKHVNLRWRTSADMEHALQNVSFNYMPTLDKLAEVKRVSKQALNAELGVLENGGEDNGGDDQGGGQEITE